MATIIVNESTTTFSINGIAFLKNFQSLLSGNSIRIVNVYDSKLEILSNTIYSDFTVDGSSYGSAALLQAALVEILFYRASSGGSGDMLKVDYGGSNATTVAKSDNTTTFSSKTIDKFSNIDMTISDLKALTNTNVNDIIVVINYDANIKNINSSYIKVSDTIGAYVDDGGGIIIGADNSVYSLQITNGRVLPGQFGLRNDNTLLTGAGIEAYLIYCASNSYIAFFTSGTYLFPYDFETSVISGNVTIQGNDKENTIITSDNNDINTFRKPKKLDLKKPISDYDDGMYYVFKTQIANDGTDDYDASWVSGLSLRDYVQISSGVSSIKTEAEVVALRWAPYLDSIYGATEPTTDGIYESAISHWLLSGTIQSIPLPWVKSDFSDSEIMGVVGTTTINTITLSSVSVTPTVGSAVFDDSLNVIGEVAFYSSNKITFVDNLLVTPLNTENIYVSSVKTSMGCTLLRNNGQWSRYNSKEGIKFNKSISIKNIKFDKVAFFICMFSSGNFNDEVDITNCDFINTRRVLASDRLSWRWTTDSMNITVQDGINYHFRNVNISDNNFDRLGEGVFWGTPTIKHTDFNGNIFTDCDNMVSSFNQLMQINSNPENEQWYYKTQTANITNNNHINCVNWYDGQPLRQFYRFLSNTFFNNNNFDIINGITAFPSSENNTITNNYFDFYCDDRGSFAKSPVITHKLITTNYNNPNIIEGNYIKKADGHFLFNNFDNDFIVRNNNYTNCTFIEYCYSLTLTLDTNITYVIVEDTTILSNTNFATLAVNYDDTIVNGSIVFFNESRNRWEKITTFNSTRAVYYKELDGDTTNNGSIFSYNNNYRADDIIKMAVDNSPTDYKFSLYIDGDNYRLNSIFNTGGLPMDLINYEIRNTKIYGLRPSIGASIKMCVNNFVLDNVEFYLNFQSTLRITHNQDIVLNRCKTLADPEYYTQEFWDEFGDTTQSSQGSIYIKSTVAGKKASFINCDLTLQYSRFSLIRNEGFNEVLFKGGTHDLNKLNVRIFDDNYKLLNNIVDISELNVEDIKIIINPDYKCRLFYSTSTLISKINLINNYNNNYEYLESIMESSLNITDLNISQKALLPTVLVDPYNGSTITNLNEI